MATLTVTLTGVCSGGNHLTFGLTGDKTQDERMQLDELTEAITDEDIVSYIRVIAKMAKFGRTEAQAKALLQAGITVNI